MTDTPEMRRRYPWVFGALERDGYKCRDCEAREQGNTLVVHHIDGSRKTGILNNAPDNLVSVCKPCHSRRHGFTNHREDVAEMRAAGMTLTQIGVELGMSRQRVQQIERVMKLPYRRSNWGNAYSNRPLDSHS